MKAFVSILPKHHYRLVATVYDAVVVLPNEGWSKEDEGRLLSEFHSMCGLWMQVRRPVQQSVRESGLSDLLDKLVEEGKGVCDGSCKVVKPVPGSKRGSHVCLAVGWLPLLTPSREAALLEKPPPPSFG
jgi:hypothetical protein